MLDYAICEISGKQYKVIPNEPLEVDLLDTKKDVEVAVLLLSDEGKTKIGTPYLKEKMLLKYLGEIKSDKIRVAKFHAKANYRKVTGHKSKLTKVVFSVKK